MSLFSIIGLIILAVVIIIGTSMKILFSNRRKKLEGFQGYIDKNQPERCDVNDDWNSID